MTDDHHHSTDDSGPIGGPTDDGESPASRRLRRLAGAGPVAVGIAFLGIVVAAVLSPTFSPLDSALSDLGAADAPTRTAVPFNGGLVLAGGIGLGFAVALFRAATHPVERAGGVVFAVTTLALAGVGVFALPHPLHTPVAVAFYVGVSVTTWVHGTGEVLAGAPRCGLVSIWVGIGHLFVWLGWAALLGGLTGLAPPESAGAVLFGAWTVATARRIRAGAGRVTN